MRTHGFRTHTHTRRSTHDFRTHQQQHTQSLTDRLRSTARPFRQFSTPQGLSLETTPYLADPSWLDPADSVGTCRSAWTPRRIEVRTPYLSGSSAPHHLKTSWNSQDCLGDAFHGPTNRTAIGSIIVMLIDGHTHVQDDASAPTHYSIIHTHVHTARQ